MTVPKFPKVFISYAWGDSLHRARVLQLAETLRGAGVEVVIDRWDLQVGQDMTAFMERMVGDPDITHVLILMDPNYTQKANARTGGVGTETQLISPDVYQDPQQTRYVPLVFSQQEGRPFVPHFLRSRLYFDLSSDQAWEKNWPELLRHLFKVRPSRPPLGRPAPELLRSANEQQGLDSRLSPKWTTVASDLAGPFQQIHQRLHEVLTWHDLDSVRAATLLRPFGFTVGVLASPSQTVDHLSEEFLSFFTTYFQVRREYLLGRKAEPGIEAGHWYKDPRRLCLRITQLHREDSLTAVAFLAREDAALFGPRPRRLLSLLDDDKDDNDIVPVLVVGRTVGGHEFYTYEIWEAGEWSYEKCRLDLKAVALFCERLNEHRPLVHLRGGRLKGKVFEALTQRRTHAAQHITEGFIGMGQKWHPSDYVTTVAHLAKEPAELPEVMKAYSRYGLDRLIASKVEPEGDL
ncbi:toll/interleukin-1 receptor domain-containing protein [Deinococcus sp. QL22]|uniref:toll/interleukin-1 receptor domain-containing protein n=1 Tax=Deinococcus sp. QL22 TaxID=2939437 RepID=UPI0020177BB1|nr:toll/interleukin-1 receptor domain-containing protein [Deinococcus sp. QL22]UQN10194.1 toll/interleukin-1 receptor domain-containing protein [Deinococcus sp. QL22]